CDRPSPPREPCRGSAPKCCQTAVFGCDRPVKLRQLERGRLARDVLREDALRDEQAEVHLERLHSVRRYALLHQLLQRRAVVGTLDRLAYGARRDQHLGGEDEVPGVTARQEALRDDPLETIADALAKLTRVLREREQAVDRAPDVRRM